MPMSLLKGVLLCFFNVGQCVACMLGNLKKIYIMTNLKSLLYSKGRYFVFYIYFKNYRSSFGLQVLFSRFMMSQKAQIRPMEILMVDGERQHNNTVATLIHLSTSERAKVLRNLLHQYSWI